jgi:TolA-binding protein
LRRVPLRVIAALLIAASQPVLGDDKVTVLPEGKSSPITIIGEIMEFDGKGLTVRLKSDGVPQRYRADEVVSVETYHQPQHEAGMEAYAAGDTARAAAEFEQALANDPRGWVQRELRAWLVRCALRRGDRAAAGAEFLHIVRADEATRHWDVAPLVWAPLAIGDGLKREARGWLAQPSEPARLLGASALLLDAASGESARREMEKLTRSTNRNVSSLAKAQQWRLRANALELSETELGRWQSEIDRMPERLRGGPTYLLGRARSQRSEYAEAAADLLWLPLVYTQDEPLAARACLEAADALARLGRSDEALTLYRETAERFSWSPEAAEARRHVHGPMANATDGPTGLE